MTMIQEGRLPDDALNDLRDVYGRYRSALFYVSTCLLEHASVEPTVATVSAGVEAAWARAKDNAEAHLDEPFRRSVEAFECLAAWVQVEQQAGDGAAEMAAVRRSHHALREAVWELDGACEYAPCGADGRR